MPKKIIAYSDYFISRLVSVHLMLFVTKSKNSILLSHIKHVFDVCISTIATAKSPRILRFLLRTVLDFIHFWPQKSYSLIYFK